MRRKVIITVTALALTTGGVLTYLSAQATTIKGKCAQNCLPSCCEEEEDCLPGECNSCE